jgi:hypothetical protein
MSRNSASCGSAARLARCSAFHVAPQQLGDPPAARARVVAMQRAQQGQAVPAHLRVDAVIAAAEGGGEGREQHVGFEAVVGAGRQEVHPDQVEQVGAQGFGDRGVHQQQQRVAAVVGGELLQGGVGSWTSSGRWPRAAG